MAASDRASGSSDGMGKIGPYKLGESIRTSLFSALYRARGLYDKKEVHLRVLLPWIATSLRDPAQVEERLVRLRMLNHPSILKVLDGGMDKGQIYMAVQPTEAKNLAEVLARTRLEGDALPVLMQEIAEGVQYLHQNEIFHGYLNLENVFFTEEGLIQIGDVEIAHLLVDAKFNPHYIPTVARAFIAPEVLAGSTPNRRVDVFSIAAILNDIINAMGAGVEVPGPARDVLWRAADEDPEVRYRSVEELRAEFLAALKGKSARPPVTLEPPPVPQQEAKARSKKGLKQMALPLGALAFIIFGVGLIALALGGGEAGEAASASEDTNGEAASTEVAQASSNNVEPAPRIPVPVPSFPAQGVESTAHDSPPPAPQFAAVPDNQLFASNTKPGDSNFVANPFASVPEQFSENLGQGVMPTPDPESGIIRRTSSAGRTGWTDVTNAVNFSLYSSNQVVVLFFDDSSAEADRLYRLFLLDRDLANALENTVRYTERPQGAQNLARRFNVTEYPMIIILGPNLQVLADYKAGATSAELAFTLTMAAKAVGQ